MTIVQVESAEQLKEMPKEYSEILTHMLLAHTEGELSGADAYREGLGFAPNARELKVLYESAADEIEHYMVGARLLADMGIDASYMLKTKVEERYHYPSQFMADYTNWAERGLTSMLAESAALEHLVEFRESSYRPFAAIVDKVIAEESVHISHGRRIVRDMCETEEGRQVCQSVLDRKWGQVLDLFGSSTSKRSVLFQKWGLRQRPNEVARQDWIIRTRPKLADMGLRAPADQLNRQFL